MKHQCHVHKLMFNEGVSLFGFADASQLKMANAFMSEYFCVVHCENKMSLDVVALHLFHTCLSLYVLSKQSNWLTQLWSFASNSFEPSVRRTCRQQRTSTGDHVESAEVSQGSSTFVPIVSSGSVPFAFVPAITSANHANPCKNQSLNQATTSCLQHSLKICCCVCRSKHFKIAYSSSIHLGAVDRIDVLLWIGTLVVMWFVDGLYSGNRNHYLSNEDSGFDI